MSKRRLVLASGLLGAVIHGLVLATVWLRWKPGTRGLVLSWIDAPFSFLWFGVGEGRMLLFSLVLGGLWWATITALLTWWIGRVTLAERDSGDEGSGGT